MPWGKDGGRSLEVRELFEAFRRVCRRALLLDDGIILEGGSGLSSSAVVLVVPAHGVVRNRHGHALAAVGPGFHVLPLRERLHVDAIPEDVRVRVFPGASHAALVAVLRKDFPDATCLTRDSATVDALSLAGLRAVAANGVGGTDGPLVAAFDLLARRPELRGRVIASADGIAGAVEPRRLPDVLRCLRSGIVPEVPTSADDPLTPLAVVLAGEGGIPPVPDGPVPSPVRVAALREALACTVERYVGGARPVHGDDSTTRTYAAILPHPYERAAVVVVRHGSVTDVSVAWTGRSGIELRVDVGVVDRLYEAARAVCEASPDHVDLWACAGLIEATWRREGRTMVAHVPRYGFVSAPIWLRRAALWYRPDREGDGHGGCLPGDP